MLPPAVRTSPPAVTPVSLAEAKAQLRVDGSDEDDLITRMIKAATAHVEKQYERALITQTWRQDFGYFDDWRIPVRDVIAISSVVYYDADNVLQTLDASNYQFLVAGGPYLALKTGQSWPTAYTRDDAIRLTWTAGFGPAESDVPEDIRHAILVMVGDMYRSRENTVLGESVSELPFAAKSLFGPYRPMVA